MVKASFENLQETSIAANYDLPVNSDDLLRRYLDRLVVENLHEIRGDRRQEPADTVKGVFVEGEPVYPGAGFVEKTHIQICVRNPAMIKGIFRVPEDQLSPV